MPTSNEDLRDALIRHQIRLLGFSNQVQGRIRALLDASEADLRRQILSRTRALAGRPEAFADRRLEVLLEVITEIRKAAGKEAMAALRQEMLDLARVEAQFAAGATTLSAPVILDLITPDPARLRAIVTARPFHGKTLKEWADKIIADDIARIHQSIKIGLVNGETYRDIARRVTGTARLKGSDGITEISRRNATALVRTATNHIANRARQETFRRNSELFTEEMFVATLDSRTTLICMGYDGQRFSVGRGPTPPLHFQCRSLRVAIMSDRALGSRPLKPTTEKMLLKEYADREGIPPPRSRDFLPYGNKGRFDAFASRRVRELTGRTPATTTYQDFLSTQPRAFQDEVLGATKAKLFRDGGLKLDRFTDRRGNTLSLSQLAAREAEAFRQAGLDPADFFR